MRCTEIAQFVRSNWSSDGVEVESTSSNKVRCRMPPMFPNLDVFVQELLEHGCTIDLESRCDDAVISVALIIYAGSDHEEWTYKGHSVPRCGDEHTNTAVWLFAALFVCLQIFTFYLLRHKIYAFVGVTF